VGLRTTHGLVSARGLVPLHPSFDTATWLAADGEVFERVGAVLLPASNYAPRRLLVAQDAWDLATRFSPSPCRPCATPWRGN